MGLFFPSVLLICSTFLTECMLQRVYLTGFMTSGKSTIGPILANVLGWNFYDLDSVIENRFQMSVVEIFEKHGEDYFRGIETEELNKLSVLNDVIISLGGGTLSSVRNLEIIKNSGLSVYLKINPETIYKRLKNKIDRPLIRDLVLNERPKDEFLERISNILEQREQYYNTAEIILETDNIKIGKTVDRLANKIRRLIDENP